MLNQFSATPNPIFTVSIVFRVSTELEPRPIYLAIEPMPAQKHHSSYMSQQHSLLAFYWSEQSWWTSDKCCFAKLKTINKRREMHQMLASASKIQLKCWVRFFLVRGTFVGKYKKAFFFVASNKVCRFRWIRIWTNCFGKMSIKLSGRLSTVSQPFPMRNDSPLESGEV